MKIEESTFLIYYGFPAIMKERYQRLLANDINNGADDLGLDEES